jgi:DNA-binding GntR family transcriptional regulator
MLYDAPHHSGEQRSGHLASDLGKATYESLNSIAYSRILKGLRDGKFEQGQSLVTRVLAKSLGISSTPVREALTRLIEQNALEVAPTSRGAVVPHLTRELLEELYDLRLILDGIAVRAAAQNITDSEIAELKALAADLDRMESDVASSEFLEKSEDFFMKVFYAARRPILFKLLDNLWLRSGVILGLLSKSRPKGFSISRQRNELVKALARRNGDAAVQAMNEALAATRDMVFSLLDEAEAPTSKAGGRKKAGVRSRRGA